MRRRFLFPVFISAICAICAPSLVSAKPRAGEAFTPPLRLDAPVISSRARVFGAAGELRDSDYYRRDRTVGADIEWALGDQFSVVSSMGETWRERSKTETYRARERLNLGFRFAATGKLTGGIWGFSGGLRVFDKKGIKQAKIEEVNPGLYIALFSVQGGLKRGPLEAVLSFSFQTETNTKLVERPGEEFRRHSLFGLALSYGLSRRKRVFLELEYREPYHRDVDEGVRFFRAYPGFRWGTADNYALSISLLFAIRRENELDRGFRLGLHKYFN